MKRKALCILLFLILCWAARNPIDEQFFAFLIATIFFIPASVAFIAHSKTVTSHFIAASVVYAVGFLVWHASIAVMRNESILEFIQAEHTEAEKSLVLFVYSLLAVASFARIMFLHFGNKKNEASTNAI